MVAAFFIFMRFCDFVAVPPRRMPRARLLALTSRLALGRLFKTGNRNSSMISAAAALPGRETPLDLGPSREMATDMSLVPIV